MARNEWGLPRLSGVVGSVKVRNALLRIDPTLTVKLKNVRINGQLRGCSGFVVDPATGRTVYLSTEVRFSGADKEGLYRTAEHDRDHRGGTNRFAPLDELPGKVIELLKASS